MGYYIIFQTTSRDIMKTKSIIITLLTIIFLPIFNCTAVNIDQSLLKTKMINDLDIIRNTFEVKYAPAPWKKFYANWDLDEQVAFAKSKILIKENITLKDYHHILNQFFLSTRDYHVGVHFFSTEAASLPFNVRGSNNRYFLSWVDKYSAPQEFAIGDEILFFGSQTINEAVEEVKRRELGNPESETDQRLAEMFLTSRVAAIGHEVPHGPITIVIKKVKTGDIITCRIAWDYEREEISSPSDTILKPKAKANKQYTTTQDTLPLHLQRYLNKPMQATFYDHFRKAFQHDTLANDMEDEEVLDAQLIGSKKSGLPPLGKIIWKAPANSTFHSYLYETPEGRKVGYIRIAEYMGMDRQVEDFGYLIRLFEQESDALVIDQVNNPGGILFYLYGLASMLSPTPLQLPTQRMTITQEDVYVALATLEELQMVDLGDLLGGSTLFGYPINKDFVDSLISHFNFVINEWDSGHYLTDTAHLYGISSLTINPTAVYSKPILVLINQLDFSCGDLFPAILQDNERATIFGTKTAGAGGAVLSHSHPNQLGVAGYTFTGSLLERLDHTPIENLGVTPDIVYDITEEDLQNGHRGYIAAIQKAVEGLLEQSCPVYTPDDSGINVGP